MFNQTVDQVADQAIAILRTGRGSAALASKATLADLDSLAFRRSVFPTYGKALSFIAVNIKNDYDLVEARTILKQSAIEMVVAYQQSLVVEQTAQIAETVVDEVAELKSMLARLEAELKAANLQIQTKLNNYQSLANSVALREKTGVKTKTYLEVTSKVVI